MASQRAGKYIKQLEGDAAYKAFVPESLPPKNPRLEIDPEMSRLLSDADRALGQLDGIATTLPNPDFFVYMYVRQEAVLSSQIEGTQSSLDDLLKLETEEQGGRDIKNLDAFEVANYVRAMNHGLKRLETLPLSLRLIREIHKELMQDVRGKNKTPGEFRTSQNWIGPDGATLNTAIFIPPPVTEMKQALSDLEKFLHEEDFFPPLIQCALIHAQFETIHPFLDGNGRVGRLLITFWLCQKKILSQPLLYLSLYLKKHRAEYYDRLMAIRNEGNWEGWLKFFLSGIVEVSRQAADTARKILDLRQKQRSLIQEKIGNSPTALPLHDLLFKRPLIVSAMVRDGLGVSLPTSINMLERFVELGILDELTGARRNRLYRFSSLTELFSKQ